MSSLDNVICATGFWTSVSTSANVIGRHGRHIHLRTVKRQLKEHGILCRRPLKGNVLTQRHRRLCVIWARNMLTNPRDILRFLYFFRVGWLVVQVKYM